MGQRYCFTLGAVKELNHIEYNTSGEEKFPAAFYKFWGLLDTYFHTYVIGQVTTIGMSKYNIKPLSKQCGMTYRASENTLFGTGMQPFIVDVNMRGMHCVGTLISSMHVLTLASCFMLTEVYEFKKSNTNSKSHLLKGFFRH